MQYAKIASGISPSLTLKIDATAKSLKSAGADVIGFGAGEPDFDTPENIKAAAVRAIEKGFTKYTPAQGMIELRQAVRNRMERIYGVNYQPDMVVISNGAKHSLFNACAAVLEPGDECIIIAPYWLTYPELIKMQGAVPVVVRAPETDGFVPNIDELAAAITDRTKAIIINSPSNPTGCVYPKTVMEQIAELAQKYDLYIISDEIYDELVYSGEPVCIAALSEDAFSRTITVNGMSKAYAMTGWRIGYTCSPKPLADIMGSYQSHATSNPCSIAQYASVEGLNGDQSFVGQMRSEYLRRRDILCELVNAVPGISCRVPEGAFYVMMNISGTFGKRCERGEITDSLNFCEYLLGEKLVAAVPGDAFDAPGFVRLSYATSEDNIRRGMGRIAEFVAELK